MSPGVFGTMGASKGVERLATALCAVLIIFVVLLTSAVPTVVASYGDTEAGEDRISPYWGGAISQWSRWIVYWAHEREVDPDLVAAVIRKESIGRASAEGPSGAVGLMMVMPAETSGLSWRPSTEELKQPSVNLRWGTGMLKQIIRDAGGDLFNALAAYNGGWEQTHIPSTARYAQSVLSFYAYAIAARHGYTYQESKQWTMALMTRVNGHITEMQVYTSNEHPVPCFGGALAFRKLFPDMVNAPRTRVTHFVDEEGHDVLVDAWLLVGSPERPSDETLVRTAPPEHPRIGHRP
jgi:hypothetical protein